VVIRELVVSVAVQERKYPLWMEAEMLCENGAVAVDQIVQLMQINVYLRV
jgi:hypothetical protein